MWWCCKRPLPPRGLNRGGDDGPAGPCITLCPGGAPSSLPPGCLGKVTPCATLTALPVGDRTYPRRAPPGARLEPYFLGVVDPVPGFRTGRTGNPIGTTALRCLSGTTNEARTSVPDSAFGGRC